MRPRLLLALLAAVPVLCAASPSPAAAQRHRDRGHTRLYAYRDGRGYRDRIFIPTHGYKEPVRRVRVDDRRYRDRDAFRYRNDSRYRDGYAYRDGRIRRRVNVVDLLLLAASRARYNDRYGYRERYSSRSRDRCRHDARGGRGGRHIRL
jgi:hypothetical protein